MQLSRWLYQVVTVVFSQSWKLLKTQERGLHSVTGCFVPSLVLGQWMPSVVPHEVPHFYTGTTGNHLASDATAVDHGLNDEDNMHNPVLPM